jgi:glutathione synthase
MDPLEDIDPDHDTTYVIMEEVESRGKDVWVCQSNDLYFESNSLSVQANNVTLQVEEEGYFEFLSRNSLDVSNFDVVWMREDPPFDLRYLHSTYLLERASVQVVNSPQGIRDSNEKLLSLEFPEHIPETWIGSSIEAADEFIRGVGGEVVAKSLEGFGGEQVFRLGVEDPNRRVLFNQLTHNGERPILLQKFLPEVKEKGDRRVIVVGGEPIGGLTRYPADDDFRSNIHSGGRVGESGLMEYDHDICEDLKPELLERGLYFVGLDLIGKKITEINVTSPTCVQEINQKTGQSLQTEIVDYVQTLL